MTSDPNTPTIVASWQHMRGNMRLDGLRFARHAFDAILDGAPKTIEQVAQELGIEAAEADRFVEFFQNVGLMNLDEDTIVGSLGLTTQNTEYNVEINGRKLHVWCALDAVGIPAALDADAKVRVDGLAHVDIQQGKLVQESPDALRISLADPYVGDDMRQEICPNISFYQQEGERHEKMAWLTVTEAMELGKTIWARPDATNTKQSDA